MIYQIFVKLLGGRTQCFSSSGSASASSSCSSPTMGSISAALPPLRYPAARRDESVVDVLHGVSVADPYRWLEDPDAEEVKEFVEAQVAITDSVLAVCEERDRLRLQIRTLSDHPCYETPSKRGGKYFYFHNTGLQAQSVLYVQNELGGEAEVLLDPNGLSDDGTVALTTGAISENGKYFGYGLSSSGSDWVTIKVMSVEDKKTLLDTLSWVKFSSISWTNDEKGFFYSRYPAPKEHDELDAGTKTHINLNHELYYHFLGTEQSKDILCWKDPENPKYLLDSHVTDDGKYLLLDISEGCDPVNKLYYCDLSALPQGLRAYKVGESLLPFIKLVDNFEASYHAVANDDTKFTFLTNKDAPRYKLIRVNINEPGIWTLKHILQTFSPSSWKP